MPNQKRAKRGKAWDGIGTPLTGSRCCNDAVIVLMPKDYATAGSRRSHPIVDIVAVLVGCASGVWIAGLR